VPPAIRLTPHGHLIVDDDPGATPIAGEIAARLTHAFDRGAGQGLVQLGAAEVTTPLPAAFAYWRDFAGRYVTTVCGVHVESGRSVGAIEPPPDAELDAIVASAPPMTGLEYLDSNVLARRWQQLDRAFREELLASGLPLQDFLHRKHAAWSVVGRVHFNLAEYKLDPETPFAFVATYTTSLSARGKAQHAPLGRALQEFAGAKNKSRLLSLLLPVQRGAESVPWLKEMVDAGDVFHPLRWTAAEAYRFLQDVEKLEAAGVIVRLPAHWKAGRPARPQARAVVGTKPPAGIGIEGLLDFQMAVTLDGEVLTKDEIQILLAGSDGLRWLRGRWVEVRRETLQKMIDEFGRIERTAAENGVSFAEAMRLVAGAALDRDADEAAAEREWAHVAPGPWLREMLAGLRGPDGLAHVDTDSRVHATLRPYQDAGVKWLNLLSSLGLGACLADDMGLGKTLQVLALVAAKDARHPGDPPVLVVAPASLLANWAAEIARFTPSLQTLVAHSSATPRAELLTIDPARIDAADVVITSYGSLLRVPWIAQRRWRMLVVDEAQAIKNPSARQTRAVKALNAPTRIALTGTPVENRLTDLWSIFDVINPGLLGSHKEFATWTKRLTAAPHTSFAPLRELVRPYILRRMKTDPAVIADLPAKTEVSAFCTLSPRQAALYQQAVDELARRIGSTEGIARRGLVLSFLMRFKQITNHPSHWLGDDKWHERDSGKFLRLREIAETIAARQEKVLVFTQFREMTGPLSLFLTSVFNHPGVVMHGGTPVGQRKKIVEQFQEDERTPFFVLSLKAGGIGLNLTAATHVIHFDRWWNPAVENQATDRAFRIGQTQPVLVHKFICRGTVEEKIEDLLAAKARLSRDVLESGAEIPLTEMSDDELLRLVALDIRQAAAE
jgi:SNF2 domain-containing protein/SNF2 helicase protein/helicase-like protein